MKSITWGQLKTAAAEAGILDDSPLFMDTGEDDGDLKRADAYVFCPIIGETHKESSDYTGFLVLQHPTK